MSDPQPLHTWTPTTYDRIARFYDAFFKITFSIGTRGYDRVARELKGGSVLDIACGTGTLLASVEGDCEPSVGIDPSIGMLEQARGKLRRTTLSRGSFYAIPFADESFDFVVETHAVSGAGIDGEAVVSEMLRVCAPGGQILIGDFAAPLHDTWQARVTWWFGRLIGDYPHDYRQLFRAAGYEPEIEELGWFGTYQFVRVRKPASPAGGA